MPVEPAVCIVCPVFLSFLVLTNNRTGGPVPSWTGQSGPVFKTMGGRERERDAMTITRCHITEQEQESIKRSPNFKGISLSCRLIATLYHTKSFNFIKRFFIFTFHSKCTCVKLCFFIFRNYDKCTQVSLVFLNSIIMVNAHVKLCHSWKKISLMPETEFLELFLLYQHLRKQS